MVRFDRLRIYRQSRHFARMLARDLASRSCSGMTSPSFRCFIIYRESETAGKRKLTFNHEFGLLWIQCFLLTVEYTISMMAIMERLPNLVSIETFVSLKARSRRLTETCFVYLFLIFLKNISGAFRKQQRKTTKDILSLICIFCCSHSPLSDGIQRHPSLKILLRTRGVGELRSDACRKL